MAPLLLALALFSPDVRAEETGAPETVAQKDGTPVMRLVGMLPEVIPIPGDPRPYADSPYAEQIDRALAYMAYKDRDPNRLFWLVLLDHLQKRYWLHERYSLKSTHAPHLRDEPMGDLGNFHRLVDPEFKVDPETIASAESYERLALQALYCDLYPTDVSLLEEMHEVVRHGMSPFLPSVGMAFLWLRDNTCLSDDPKFMLVRDGLAVSLRNHLRYEGVATFMVGQSLAILFALGYSDMVNESWLKTIAEAQNADGGWPGINISEQKGASDGAATIHILWALLQHAMPNAPAISLVPKVGTDLTE